jgi:hypothetical protein
MSGAFWKTQAQDDFACIVGHRATAGPGPSGPVAQPGIVLGGADFPRAGGWSIDRSPMVNPPGTVGYTGRGLTMSSCRRAAVGARRWRMACKSLLNPATTIYHRDRNLGRMDILIT